MYDPNYFKIIFYFKKNVLKKVLVLEGKYNIHAINFL